MSVHEKTDLRTLTDSADDMLISSSICSVVTSSSKRRAKVEAAKARVNFAQKEAEIKKKQAELDAELIVLKRQEELAVANAELVEDDPSQHNRSLEDLNLPKEDAGQRTAAYVYNSTGNEHAFNPQAPEFKPALTKDNSAQQAPFDWSTHLMRKELMLNRLSTFEDDKPESYTSWKETFCCLRDELKLKPIEELDLMIKWLGPESRRQAYSAKAANPQNPGLALQDVWDRLEDRFGTPEIVEHSMRKKLSAFPKINAKGLNALYTLADLLSEIQAIKNNPQYSAHMSYFDTPVGINPVVCKLPNFLQEKWTAHAVNYNKKQKTHFPPWSEFTSFIKEQSRIRNNPAFMYANHENETPAQKKNFESTTPKRAAASHVMTRKTDVAPEATSTDEKNPEKVRPCPIHNSGHALSSCRAFRTKTLPERKEIMKKAGICFRCCESGHLRQDCKATLTCDCGSDKHPPALHIDPIPKKTPEDGKLEKESAEEQSPNPANVSTKCTQICRDASVTSKSCAKILPVRVYSAADRSKKIKTYAIIDDQSNRTLARSDLFESLDLHGEEHPYTLTSCHGQEVRKGRRSSGLIVESMDGTTQYRLPTVIECDHVPSGKDEIPVPEIARHYDHLSDLEGQLNPIDSKTSVLLLIGRDLIAAHHVHDQRIGPSYAPYAQRLSLGWVVVGETCLNGSHMHEDHVTVNKTFVLHNGRPSLQEPCENKLLIKEVVGHQPLTDLPTDFKPKSDLFLRTRDDDLVGTSVEDRMFLELMDRSFVRDKDGHWTAPLPFRPQRPKLPNNREQAWKRARSLTASLEKDPVKKQQFTEFMDGIFRNGHAEKAPPLKDGEECWFLPIFGVYHPKKPGKLRVVFDSAAQNQGISLNDVLMSGPDLTNSLLGVLLRFRQDKVAVMADIQQMFFCFKVAEGHRNYLRFLWHQDNNPEKQLIEYRMKVHVFGNNSSPAVATYGLRKTAQTMEKQFGADVKDFITNNCYVDDGLVSLPTAEQAVDLLSRVQKALLEGGNIRLHKISSNSSQVMASFPTEDLASNLQNLDLTQKNVPLQRSLGIVWDIQEDAFSFQIPEEDGVKITRRSALSIINSLYDPLGLLSPVTIKGKLLLRQLVSITNDWDEDMPAEMVDDWEGWRASLRSLMSLKIPRRYNLAAKPAIRMELHVFADASEEAIAAVAFLRVCTQDQVELSLVLGKAKVAPKHATSIPRLELCAALLAAEIGDFICRNLTLHLDGVTYYSDNKAVLGYITNRTRRFYIYVANRVQQILRYTTPESWTYVPTHANPADEGTRPVPADQLQHSKWLNGPEFLRTSLKDDQSKTSDEYTVASDDPEVRPEVKTSKTSVAGAPMALGTARFTRFSRWTSLIRAIARLLQLAHRYSSEKKQKLSELDLRQQAYDLVIQEVQRESFPDEISDILAARCPEQSKITNLDPFLDEKGLLRVGGRIHFSTLMADEKHPLLIPASHHIATLLIWHHHELVHHQGRHLTEGAIRSAGLWIIGGKGLVSSLIYRCVTCKRLRGKAAIQKMASLPADRLVPGPPFTNVGLDAFGPWEVSARKTRGGHALSKRWAIIFSCLTTRAVHIEVVEEMTTSSFINALRRFYAIRGPAKILRSDRGTNFVGCANALQEYLVQNGTTWIFNTPHDSHAGGAWERMIGIARRILDGLLLNASTKMLTHEVLVTFLAEVSAIMNARPLVPVSSDPQNPQVLSPGTLLTQKAPEMQALTKTCGKDLFLLQWRRVQALADTFWKRWKSDFLPLLQTRQKWIKTERNFKAGDVVLYRDKSSPRNIWPIGRVVKSAPSDDGLTRSVEICVLLDGKPHTYNRPISELTLLVAAD